MVFALLMLTFCFQPSIHQDGELQKAAKEVKQLREDESSLRHENMMLKVGSNLFQVYSCL